MHVAALMAVAKFMVAARDHWSGTLTVLFQPDEELTGGAQAMVDDVLYCEKHRIPIPDVVLGQHVLVIKAGSPSLLDQYSLPLIRSLFGSGGVEVMARVPTNASTLC